MVLVSVAMITYNHEQYIEEAINSVLMQTGDFDLELIIANDHSKDKTDIKVKEILKNNPDSYKIKYIHREENIGMLPNFMDVLMQSKGKYIAMG